MIKKIAILLPVFFLIFLMAFCLPEEQLSQQAPQLEPRQNEKPITKNTTQGIGLIKTAGYTSILKAVLMKEANSTVF